MDKVTAAMVLTSLSTSPLVRSPPVRPNGEPRGQVWGGAPGHHEHSLPLRGLIGIPFLPIEMNN